MISFRVPAVPVAQPRQRHRVVAAHGRTFAQNYTPKGAPVNAFKATVRMAAAEAMKGQGPLDGPLTLAVEFVMPRPSSLVWKTRSMPRCEHTKKPDLDNLVKAVKDALSGLAWRDDCQVCVLRASKCIAAGDETPAVTVTVEVRNADDNEGTEGG